MSWMKEKMTYVTKKIDSFENGQDRMIVILERLDQERVLTEHALKKLEKDVGSNTADIKKIKVRLKNGLKYTL